jgi:excisionase family DNA binding protein
MAETKTNDQYPDFLNRKQLCEYLHIGANRSYQLSNRRDFPKVAFGNRYVFPRQQVKEWMERQADINSVPKILRALIK